MGNRAIPIWLIGGLFASLLVFYTPGVKAAYPMMGHVADYLPGQAIEDSSASGRWDLSRIMAPPAWQIIPGGPGVTVAVLDTGIDPEHEDLAGKVTASINFTDSPTADDIYGHGTHVAGIIGAIADNHLGTTGLAYNCNLLNVKVAEDDGSLNAAAVARGIIWAADNGARVINLSLVIGKPDIALEEAVAYAWGKGCLVVAAAGNGFTTSPVYPAAYPHVIAVAATDQNDRLVRWSNRGDWITVAAPGVDIYSTLPGNRYASESGTSYAAALVSGEAALLSAGAARLHGDGGINDAIFGLIRDNCDNVNNGGDRAGRINVLAAVRAMVTGYPSGK